MKRHSTCTMVAGTMIAGLSITCGSQVRLQHRNKANVIMINTWVALLQFTTTALFLIGWFWSIVWSVDFICIASELPRPVNQAANAIHSLTPCHNNRISLCRIKFNNRICAEIFDILITRFFTHHFRDPRNAIGPVCVCVGHVRAITFTHRRSIAE